VHDHQDALEAYSRGLEYLDYNEPDQAILAFTEALKLNPRHIHAYFARGCAWVERGDLERAIADYNDAIRLDPNYAAAYSNRAAALKQRGDVKAAAADLERCRSLQSVVMN
jgi:tetratricopeptide (TPR) repeat protein